MDEQPLNDIEASILLALEQHPGRDEAISREALVRQVCDIEGFAVCERFVRATIKHLVERHGARIGSCARGYFMIQTAEELQGACKYYHGYAMSLLHVEAKLRKESLPELLGQILMEFGG